MDLSAVRALALNLMGEHGLTAQGWTFKFDRATVRAGRVRYGDRPFISVSAALMAAWPDHEVAETLRHEVAHALCPPGTRHGPLWQRAAIRVGAKPTACYPASLPTAGAPVHVPEMTEAGAWSLLLGLAAK